MATPLMMGNDLSSLGQNILQAFATESQARAQQNNAQNQLLAQIANSRLGQQQIAQRGQSDQFNAMLQVAALRDAQDQRRQDFQNIMAQEAARNAARMAELDRSIVGNKEIAQIQNGRYGSNDPRLAIEQAREDAEIEEFNIAAENAASIANQKLAVAARTRDMAKAADPAWYTKGEKSKKEQDAADLEFDSTVAGIALIPGIDPSLIRYDPVSKRFIPAKRAKRTAPGQAAARPPGIPPVTAGPVAGALPPDVQAALMAVAGAGPAVATGTGSPPPPVVIQNGVRFQLGPNGWMAIQ